MKTNCAQPACVHVLFWKHPRQRNQMSTPTARCPDKRLRLLLLSTFCLKRWQSPIFFLPGTVKCVPKVNITGTNETPGPFGPTFHFIIIISDITRWFWDPQLSYIQQMGLRNPDKYPKVETYKWINRTSIMLTRPPGKKRVKPKPPQTLRSPARNYQLLISCRNVSLSKLRTQKVPRPEGTPTSLKNAPWFESPASCKRWRKVAGAN